MTTLNKKVLGALSVGVAVASVGLTNNVAFADETVDNTKTEEKKATYIGATKEDIEKAKETEKQAEEKKEVTQEEVNKAKAEDTVKETELNKAEEDLNKAKADVKENEEKTEQAEKDVEKAEKNAENATEENINKTKEDIEKEKTNKEELAKDVETKEQDKAKAEKDVADKKAEQDKAKTDVEKAKNDVADAEKKVADKKDILENSESGKFEKAVKDTETKKAETEKAKEKAKADLEQAKKDDKARDEKIKALDVDKGLKEADKNTKQTELDKAKANATEKAKAEETTKTALDKAKADVETVNVITLTPRYKELIKEAAKYARNTPEFERLVLLLNAETDNMWNANRYKRNNNDDYKTMYDLNNLPLDIKKRITFYALDLLKGARQQVNGYDIFVTEDSIELAHRVAQNYRRDNWDGYDNGHDEDGITDAAATYKLNDGGQYYENLIARMGKTPKVSYGQLKEMVYEDIMNFLANGVEYNHALSQLSPDSKTDTKKGYFGLDFSTFGSEIGRASCRERV